MLKRYDGLISQLKDTTLEQWSHSIPEIIRKGLDTQRFGDLPDWLNALDKLPIVPDTFIASEEPLTISSKVPVEHAVAQLIEKQLRMLSPWRKGPFQVLDTFIDTEWRSDWKWQRLAPHIASLNDKCVLDVGCGNGYHAFRAHLAGARHVLGVDPSPRFIIQFHMVKHFLGNIPVDILPCTLDDFPDNYQHFDTVFSMGVLYHRRSPIDHLKQLRAALKPGGELVLETLIIHGDDHQVLLPDERYAKMRNVWFLPSVGQLVQWLKRSGFVEARCVDINQTTTDEQRATSWMTFQSLEDFLDANNHNLTIEGYPAPLRGLFIAR